MRRAGPTLFSVAFFDLISCAFGAVILLAIVLMAPIVDSTSDQEGTLVLQIEVQNQWTRDMESFRRAYVDDFFRINGERWDASHPSVSVTAADPFPTASASKAPAEGSGPPIRTPAALAFARALTLVHTNVRAPLQVDYVLKLNQKRLGSNQAQITREDLIPPRIWVRATGAVVSEELRPMVEGRLLEANVSISENSEIIFPFKFRPDGQKKLWDWVKDVDADGASD